MQSNNKKRKDMKSIIKIKKGIKTIIPEEYLENDGVVAFQLVEVTVNLYGREMVNRLDTRIYEDGKQEIISGTGCIPDSTRIDNLDCIIEE